MSGGKNRRGFTIVELLLATAIFSTVLMVVISGFLQIGRLFYKGVTLTNTQQVSRQVLDNVSNDVRFNNSVSFHQSGVVIDNNVGYYCVGNTRYTFNLYHIVPADDKYGGVNNDTDFGLLRDTMAGATGCADPFLSLTAFNPANIKEMLSPGMRLNGFSLNSINGQVYDINVDVVSGDDTSLQPLDSGDPTGPQKCTGNLKNSQYCAESKLNTSISVNTGALNANNVRQNGIIVKKGGKGHGDVKSTINCSDNSTIGCDEVKTYGNVDCGSACQIIYPKPVTILLDIPTPVDTYSSFKQYTFTKGQGCDAARSTNHSKPNNVAKCYLKIEGGVYVTAVYNCTNPSKSCDYTLNINKTGDGSGSVTSDQKINCGPLCSQTFDKVTTVVLNASVLPSDNSAFKSWSVKCTGKGESSSGTKCTVQVNKAIDVSAKFQCKVAACSWDITVDKTGSGNGTIQSTPDPSTQQRKIDCGGTCSASFPAATTISLTAIPADGSVFKSWSGAKCTNNSTTDNPCSFSVNDSIDVKAKFDKL